METEVEEEFPASLALLLVLDPGPVVHTGFSRGDPE